MLKKILLLALLPAIAFAEELPAPVKAIEKQGITIIKTFDAPGGMKGSPATAAAILASKDPAKTWQQYEASGGKLKLNVPANVSTEQMKVLSDNEKLMDDLGANVTPAIYYMSKENTLQQAVGLPDQKTLNIIMGNK